jgi:hypothetical protein
MKTIDKFSFVPEIGGPTVIEMPKGAKILSAESSMAAISIFALVDVLRPTVRREIFIYSTGDSCEDLPESAFFFRTVDVPDGRGNIFTLHLFITSEPRDDSATVDVRGTDTSDEELFASVAKVARSRAVSRFGSTSRAGDVFALEPGE